MAFLLAVVTTVGSLPTAPVFAAEDEIEEVVVEDAGSSVSVGELTTMKVVSKNGSSYAEEELEDVQISANEVLSVSVNFSGATDDLDTTGYDLKAVASIETLSGNYAVLKVAESKMVSGNRMIFTETDIQIEGKDNGTGTVTIQIVSKNEAGEYELVNEAASKSFELTVVKVEEDDVNNTTDDTTEEATDDKTDDKTTEEEQIDPEVLAEAQKDAEGVDAFTQLIDIDPDAVNQEIYMVVKQSFTDEALKGFDYVNQEKAAKKADKKVVTISKKGKIAAKKEGTVVFTKTDNGVVKTLSVNVVKPVMPTKKAKVSVAGGATETIKLSGLEKAPSMNVVFISSDPTKASVSYDSAKREAYVTGIVKGKVNVIAYVNGKTYKTPVKVTSTVPVEKTYVGYINKGVKNKAIKVTGVKKWEIISANDAVLTLNSKGTKFTAGVAGAVSVNGLDKKGNKVVTGWIYVQDLDLTAPESISVNGVSVNAGKKLVNETKESKRGANKKETYSITIKLDQKEGVNGNIKKGYAKVVFANYAQDQAVVFKSSKAANVYYNGNGLIVAKKAYKKPIKLTGKINGKTIVIKVKVEE